MKPSNPLPGVPSMPDTGSPGFEFSGWHGLLAQKATPPAIVELLNRKLLDRLADPVVMARFVKGRIDAVTNSPSGYAAFLGNELKEWCRIIQERNIRAF